MIDLDRLTVSLNGVRPTMLDRMIGYVSPQKALSRMRARAGLAVAAAYTGARTDRRSLKTWDPAAGSANADILPELGTLRGRSRDLVRNAPLAGGAVHTVVTNVIGTGLQCRPTVDRDILGLSDEEAEDWERQAVAIWRAWSRSANCDLTRTDDFAGLQDLAFRSVLESGDILVVRRFRERRGDILGVKIQLIEGDRISNPDGLPDTARLAGGVEIDGNGAPLRYHVLNNHPGDRFYYWAGGDSWTSIPAFGRSSQERLAILLYRRTRPNQVRGVPYLAPVIEPLKQLDRYSEAELTAAVVAGMFTVFVKAESAGDEGGIAPLSDTQSQLTDTAAGDIRLGSGTIIDLMPGEDVVTADPNRPNVAYDAFVQSVLRQIGVGLELPYEILIKHFTRSYSAARTSILEAWKFFRVRRDWLAKRFCQPVYSWVISEAVMRELIAAPGFQDATIRDAWLGAKWIGPAPGQIDPEREINAADKRVMMGISTLEEETAALTGGDWDQKHRQRAKERQMRYEAGLESSEVGAGEKLAPPPAAERETEEEEAAA